MMADNEAVPPKALEFSPMASAPSMAGIDNRKENRPASLRSIFRKRAADMVDPDREIPGIICKALNKADEECVLYTHPVPWTGLQPDAPGQIQKGTCDQQHGAHDPDRAEDLMNDLIEQNPEYCRGYGPGNDQHGESEKLVLGKKCTEAARGLKGCRQADQYPQNRADFFVKEHACRCQGSNMKADIKKQFGLLETEKILQQHQVP